MRSSELDDLSKALLRTNYYELEDASSDACNSSAPNISHAVTIGECFFRARIGFQGEALRTDLEAPEDDVPVQVVFPYIGEQLAAPPQDVARGGRLNRSNITFLYLASTLETALAEVRPHPGHTVSIGQFRSDRNLKIANLAGVELLPFATSEAALRDFVLLRSIEYAFATPVLPDDPVGYLLTQFLADTLRRMGFNGAMFHSSVTAGVNLVAFEPAAFSYVAGSADVRTIISVAYAAETPSFEVARSTAPGVQYWPVRKGR